MKSIIKSIYKFADLAKSLRSRTMKKIPEDI